MLPYISKDNGVVGNCCVIALKGSRKDRPHTPVFFVSRPIDLQTVAVCAKTLCLRQSEWKTRYRKSIAAVTKLQR